MEGRLFEDLVVSRGSGGRVQAGGMPVSFLLHVAGLILVLADGSRHRLPRPIDAVQGDGRLECFLSTDVQT